MPLLKFTTQNSYQEPLFGISFSEYVRLNFPKIPIKYKQIKGVICDKVPPLSLNINPKYSDSDIYICIKFKLNSVTADYAPIFTTEYKGESHPIIRIISNGFSVNQFVINLFNRPNDSNTYTSNTEENLILFRKLNNSRNFYNNPISLGSSFNTGVDENLTDLKIFSPYANFNLYELFIRINGTVHHNWVPCINSLTNKCGFINSITGDFITNDNMSPIE